MRSSLSVAIVAPLVAPLRDAQPYGNHIFIGDLARGLQARGHRVVVYAAAGSRVFGVTVEPIAVDAAAQRRFLLLRDHDPDEAGAMQRAFDALFARLCERHHDVVSQHAFDGGAIAARLPLPALHTLHLPPMRPPLVDVAARCRAALASVSITCAHAWSVALERRVLALPNGVPDRACPTFAPRPVALMAGRISREKGFHTGVRIARRCGLAPRVVGEIYDEEYFKDELLPALGDLRVEAPLHRDELRAQMTTAAVVLMPVEWDEPFGLVAAEAQLAGCPVVGYARGALPEVVVDGEGGFLAPAGDEHALAAAVDAARTLDRVRVREHARARFAMDSCIDRYESVLDGLARSSS